MFLLAHSLRYKELYLGRNNLQLPRGASCDKKGFEYKKKKKIINKTDHVNGKSLILLDDKKKKTHDAVGFVQMA